MITQITGAPGAGKSAAAMVLMKQWAGEGRKIYVDGIPELAVEHEMIDASKWDQPGVVADGAVIFIDEAQRVWRPAGTGSKVSADIAALETHRHRGLDFVVITQHPNLINANVRRLVGRHIHLRDTGITGRWWYEWPESTNPELFRNAPVKKSGKIDRSVFDLYKSASVHVKPKRSIPPIVIVLGLSLVGVALLGWKVVSIVGEKTGVIKAATAPTVTGTPPMLRPGPQAPAGEPRARSLGVGPPVKVREPYAGMGLHASGSYIVGAVRRTWFALSVEGRVVATLSEAQLVESGYFIRTVGPCAVVLSLLDGRERFVTCDSPSRAPVPGAPRAEPEPASAKATT